MEIVMALFTRPSVFSRAEVDRQLDAGALARLALDHATASDLGQVLSHVCQAVPSAARGCRHCSATVAKPRPLSRMRMSRLP